MGRRSAWRDNDRVRTQGAAVLVNAALAAGARLYVQESITFLYADQGERWIDETASIDAVWPLASARDAERETARFSAGGGAGVVLRFALFYAPYAASTRDTIRLARWRLFPILGDGNAYMSAIHVDESGTLYVGRISLNLDRIAPRRCVAEVHSQRETRNPGDAEAGAYDVHEGGCTRAEVHRCTGLAHQQVIVRARTRSSPSAVTNNAASA